jgi:hypothetical protein
VPEKRAGEPLNKFVARFTGSKREVKRFPDLKQRQAAGESRKPKK